MAFQKIKPVDSAKIGVFNTPFALSIGPQRAGTSWLDRYLRSRGDICLPSQVKEVFFFDRNYDRGLAYYAGHFQQETHHRLAMEISTTSFDHPEAPLRIRETAGLDVRLICPLRHPIVRSYSLYRHYMRYGLVKGTLREACFQNPQILNSSKYARHIKNWMLYFGRGRINIFFQEDLEKNQEQYVMKICRALRIPYVPVLPEIQVPFNTTTNAPSHVLAKHAQHASDWLRRKELYPLINAAKAAGLKRLIFGANSNDIQKSGIPAEDRAWLEEQLQDQVETLEELIGPIPQWR